MDYLGSSPQSTQDDEAQHPDGTDFTHTLPAKGNLDPSTEPIASATKPKTRDRGSLSDSTLLPDEEEEG